MVQFAAEGRGVGCEADEAGGTGHVELVQLDEDGATRAGGRHEHAAAVRAWHVPRVHATHAQIS